MMFDYGVTALQEYGKSQFSALCHWIPESTNQHTIVMAEKVNHTNPESASIMFMLTIPVSLKVIMDHKSTRE